MDASLWISYVLLVAKDAHIEYFVLFLPALVALLYQRKRTTNFILAMVSFGLISLSWIAPLPFVTLPMVLLWLPTALLGNIVLMISIALHEKSVA